MSRSSSSEASGETALRLLMLSAVFAIPVVVVLQPVIDWDLWWHLRTGEWVLEHGHVPATDPFSTYGQGKPWVAYSWLFEVLLALCFRSLGLTGVMLFTLTLSLLNAGLLYRFLSRRLPSFLKATALTALALLALAMLCRPRPWQFSILFSQLTLQAVLALREGKTSRAVWLLPLAYALWANLHIQWVYGLLLLALAVLAPLFDRWLGWDSSPGYVKVSAPAWDRLILLFFLCLLATLLNPYHMRIYGVVWEYASQPGPFQFVPELMAPLFRQPSDWAMLILAGLAVFALGRAHPDSQEERLGFVRVAAPGRLGRTRLPGAPGSLDPGPVRSGHHVRGPCREGGKYGFGPISLDLVARPGAGRGGVGGDRRSLVGARLDRESALARSGEGLSGPGRRGGRATRLPRSPLQSLRLGRLPDLAVAGFAGRH